MNELNLHNPVFAAYAIAASLMILKAASMSWLTVLRMMQVNGGFRSRLCENSTSTLGVSKVHPPRCVRSRP